MCQSAHRQLRIIVTFRECVPVVSELHGSIKEDTHDSHENNLSKLNIPRRFKLLLC